MTFVLEEPSFYQQNSNTENLYCDIGSIKILNDYNIEEPSSGFFAYKIYSFPPSSSITSITDLSKLFNLLENSKLPIFIDPNFPDSRMLFMSSPLRHESVENHAKNDTKLRSNIFAAAYSDNVESDISEESNDFKKVSSLIESLSGCFDEEILIKNFEKTKGGDEIIEISKNQEFENTSNKRRKRYKLVNHSTTLFDSLNKRIRDEQKSYQVLCIAEAHTYMFSGCTSFSNGKREVLDLENIEKAKEKGKKCSEHEKPLIKRPPKINTETEDLNKCNDYNYFLANCPEH